MIFFSRLVAARDPFHRTWRLRPWARLWSTIQKLRTPAVLAGLGVAQVAGDSLVADCVDAGGVGEGHEADRVFVLFHVQLLQAVGGLGRALGEILRVSPRKMCWKASWVPEAPSRFEQVDRAGDLCARDFTPVVDAPREDAFYRLLGQVGDGVLGVG